MGAQCLYFRLFLVADDYGRFPGSLVTIRSACWPLDPEKVRQGDVSKWFTELIKGDDALIRVYDVGGIPYIEIQNFRQQIRSKSKYPNPPWFQNQQVAEESATHDAQHCDIQPENHNAKPIRSRSRMQNADANNTHDASGAVTVSGHQESPTLAKRRKKATADVEKALGERLTWFNRCWEAFPRPGRNNKRGAMEVFERKVKEHGLAATIYRGIERYAAKVAADPTMKVKYFQGWINDERWTDESEAQAPVVRNGAPPQATMGDRRRAELVAGIEMINKIERRA